MAVTEDDTGLVFLNGKDIFSLKTEELKAELDRRGFKKSGNKCTLVERLRTALISERIFQRLKMTSNTHKLAYPRSRNILIYRNQSERGMPS